MEKNHVHAGPDSCGGWCGCGHNHILLRWFLGIVILLLVFMLGMKVGEIKGTMESQYGHPGKMMRGYAPYYPPVTVQRDYNRPAMTPGAATSATPTPAAAPAP